MSTGKPLEGAALREYKAKQKANRSVRLTRQLLQGKISGLEYNRLQRKLEDPKGR